MEEHSICDNDRKQTRPKARQNQEEGMDDRGDFRSYGGEKEI